MIRYLGITALAVLLFACGSGDKPVEEKKPKIQLNTGMEDERPADIPVVAELVIEGGDDMRFNTKYLEVWSGQKVKLTLKHVGELPVEAMGHNWVLLKAGVDKGSFAEASIAAKDNNYIAPDQQDNVIAHTTTIGGGDSVTIEFDAPEAGTYDFLCSFPGHFGMMSGKFKVK